MNMLKTGQLFNFLYKRHITSQPHTLGLVAAVYLIISCLPEHQLFT